MPDAQKKQRQVRALIDGETLDRLSGRGEISIDKIGRVYGLGDFLKRSVNKEDS